MSLNCSEQIFEVILPPMMAPSLIIDFYRQDKVYFDAVFCFSCSVLNGEIFPGFLLNLRLYFGIFQPSAVYVNVSVNLKFKVLPCVS